MSNYESNNSNILNKKGLVKSGTGKNSSNNLVKHAVLSEEFNYLNNSHNDEVNNFQKEADLLSDYIKSHYQKTKDFPLTSIKFYKFGRLLGRGAFGKVNIGLHILTGRLVAIKSFNKSLLSSEKSKNKILHEVKLMQKLNQASGGR